jgi:hypothetical protein
MKQLQKAIEVYKQKKRTVNQSLSACKLFLHLKSIFERFY